MPRDVGTYSDCRCVLGGFQYCICFNLIGLVGRGGAMKIVRFPGAKLTPQVLLAQVLEDVDYLESVVIIEKGKNGDMEVAWSRQEQQDVAFAIFVLEQKLLGVMDDTPVDNETEDAS